MDEKVLVSQNLYTPEEAICYLRLDKMGLKNPRLTLDYYRKKGLIRAIQISRCIMYLKEELDNFLKRIAEHNSR